MCCSSCPYSVLEGKEVQREARAWLGSFWRAQALLTSEDEDTQMSGPADPIGTQVACGISQVSSEQRAGLCTAPTSRTHALTDMGQVFDKATLLHPDADQ